LGRRANFNGIVPDTQIRAIYQFPDKRVTMFASENIEGGSVTEVRYRAFARRNIENLPVDEQDEFVISVLAGLSEDIDGFIELATHFYFG
jgi:hypothetical protein